ncbi:BTB domain-containing protein, partial [Gryllus bimaculatus]
MRVGFMNFGGERGFFEKNFSLAGDVASPWETRREELAVGEGGLGEAPGLGAGMGSSGGGTSSSNMQQYCLRWNNHRTNLLTVFDDLLRSEAFTDVTLACEGGQSVKCHKMVLAACSSYFQALFTELPCQHPVVVLKDVKYGEMKAILEYMYRGEVNVAHDHLAALLKVADALKVKGLVEENGPLTSTPNSKVASRREEEVPSPPPSITTSTSNASPMPHSSSGGALSPPSSHSHYYKRGLSANIPPHGWPLAAGLPPGLTAPPSVANASVPAPPPPGSGHTGHPHMTTAAAVAAAAVLNCYEHELHPLKRKKLQSLLMGGRAGGSDTPILRTVLGQGQADSSQPISLVCQPDSHERIHSNGSAHDTDKVSVKAEQGLDEARSPYTDISGMDDDHNDKVNFRSSVLSQSFPGDIIQTVKEKSLHECFNRNKTFYTKFVFKDIQFVCSSIGTVIKNVEWHCASGVITHDRQKWNLIKSNLTVFSDAVNKSCTAHCTTK